jgi:hypothetical protein
MGFLSDEQAYQPNRKPEPITEAGCWAHARRKLFELADIASKARNGKPTTISPIAFEAVQKFDAIFMLERSINAACHPEARMAARRKDIASISARTLRDYALTQNVVRFATL